MLLFCFNLCFHDPTVDISKLIDLYQMSQERERERETGQMRIM